VRGNDWHTGFNNVQEHSELEKLVHQASRSCIEKCADCHANSFPDEPAAWWCLRDDVGDEIWSSLASSPSLLLLGEQLFGNGQEVWVVPTTLRCRAIWVTWVHFRWRWHCDRSSHSGRIGAQYGCKVDRRNFTCHHTWLADDE
jgi:hypothetical protein